MCALRGRSRAGPGVAPLHEWEGYEQTGPFEEMDYFSRQAGGSHPRAAARPGQRKPPAHPHPAQRRGPHPPHFGPAGAAVAAGGASGDGTGDGDSCESPLVLDGFDQGGYRLLPQHFASLRNLTIRLRDNPPAPGAVLRVRGFADPTSDGAADSGLSLARAIEVRNFMGAALRQVNVSLPVVVSGAGATEPVSANGTAHCQPNDRVELSVCTGGFAPSGAAAPPGAAAGLGGRGFPPRRQGAPGRGLPRPGTQPRFSGYRGRKR